jgi:ABC-2 type transport system permease protein
MNKTVFLAIFKRNFTSYFASPTGYVFICVFVLLSSFAAFWPNEFFNANLANLDQLNAYFPYIMLVFIPAITMSIWSEERRQGTDELLLTLPATDLDVVLGKYVASLAIFRVALLFSLFSNYCVLSALGAPDAGLFASTYFGYWMIGLAMLAVGMVASFLTSNLTVGFILGAIFNAPLAFSAQADLIIKQPEIAQLARQWSLARQFSDFERGVISISSVCYFTAIAAVMLYLAIVLIGRRHWLGGRDGHSMLQHYAARTLALVVAAVGVSWFFMDHDFVRADITSEQLSSLSSDTRELIRDLKVDQPVRIEAYVSEEVPSQYVQAKINLLSMLDELASLGGGKIQVVKHITDNFSDEAVLAEQKYGITPRTVLSRNRGAWSQKDILMGVAVTCGLEKVVVPFINKGLPVEYELIRSICTVAQEERKKIGVLTTDANLFGGASLPMMGATSEQALIEELRKQYEVVEVDPSEPITASYDVLLAVQPSSLTPEQMTHFVNAVKSGQPTAIFEDPYPIPDFWPNTAGTAQPRQQPHNPLMMFNQPPQQPKGDINELWRLLGIDVAGDEIIWQNYNPYPRERGRITPEWVFIDDGSGAKNAFNPEESISSGLQQVLFLYPGSVRPLKAEGSKLKFAPLAQTGRNTGTLQYSDMQEAMRAARSLDLSFAEVPTQETYVLAAHITGAPAGDDAAVDAGLRSSGDEQADEAADKEKAEDDDADEKADEPAKLNVVVVADIDCLARDFFFIREIGKGEEGQTQFEFDNVTFVLNALDVLAGDNRFLQIRKRRRVHRTLDNLESLTEAARAEAAKRREASTKQMEAERAKAQNAFGERIAEIQENQELDPRTKQIQMQMARQNGQRALDVTLAQLQRERDEKLEVIERELAMRIRSVQDRYKLWAVLLPPLPPLLLAFFVFFHRRQQEREGVSKSRLR